jgi:hypothetical protein
MAPKSKLTFKADNGRMFRGKPQDRDETSLRRQFKKPRRTGETNDREVRHLTETEVVIEVAEDSDGSEDNIPFSQLKEKNVADREGSEDSPEAQPYETLESEVVIEVAEESDGSEDNIPFSELKEKIVAEREGSDNDEDYTTLPDTNEKMSPKLGLLGIGTEVMKQFDAGLFVGTVQSYNRKDSLYKIKYSDGDMEDMDEEEYVYAYQLALANGGEANDLSSCDSADEESAYQQPKLKVTLFTLIFKSLKFISFYFISFNCYLSS